jgi:hypothetical protein
MSVLKVLLNDLSRPLNHPPASLTPSTSWLSLLLDLLHITTRNKEDWEMPAYEHLHMSRAWGIKSAIPHPTTWIFGSWTLGIFPRTWEDHWDWHVDSWQTPEIKTRCVHVTYDGCLSHPQVCREEPGLNTKNTHGLGEICTGIISPVRTFICTRIYHFIKGKWQHFPERFVGWNWEI